MSDLFAGSVKIIDGCEPNRVPDEVYASTQPVVLKGLVRHWPLVGAALDSPGSAVAMLKEHYSGQLAPVYFASPSVKRWAYNQDVNQLNFEIKKANIAEVLDELLAGVQQDNPPVRYIASNIIDTYFPSLIEQNDLPFDSAYFIEHPLEFADPLRGIWIGNKTNSPCHYDAQSNIACCIAGQRKLTLFPPEQVHNLYPGPLDLNPGGPAITMVDFDEPDFERFPRFAEAIKFGQIAHLEPGDAIFIPCMWWHQVEALSPFNILINYWWNTYPKIRGQAMNVLYHALMSIRDRPEQEKQAWKHLFDYYVFDSDTNAGSHLPAHARGYLGAIDENAARKLRAMLLQKLNR